MTKEQILKHYFGFDSFKEGQEKIINSLLGGRDVLAIMPTGAGKSICYQVPALMFRGVTIVISPLISLMQDQVHSLNEDGINAAFINSSLTENQIRDVMHSVVRGECKIIYVSPERLESNYFNIFVKNIDISMVTVDEAHCISQWGQDFRPSYLKIKAFVDSLDKRPIISAFTATATEEVREDIICVLNLKNPNVVVTGFDRKNLYYCVEQVRNKDDFVMKYINKHAEENGIIYCSTRKMVDEVFEMLCANGVAAGKYHAGMENEERKNSQDDFIYDRIAVIVATNAFGMGIDKSNVRYVIHYNMPKSMEEYYQEAGRAGRDGLEAQCVLLFSLQDVRINKFILDNKDFSTVEPENVALIKQRDLKRLWDMQEYCRTTSCLRNYICNYFGEKTYGQCDNCGNCHREYQVIDMTEEAKWVINCIVEAKGRYGMSVIIGTLMGANRSKLRDLNTISYKSYGMLNGKSEGDIRKLIEQMIFDGYIYQTLDKYSVLKIKDIQPLQTGEKRVIVRKYAEKETKLKKQLKNSTGENGTVSLTQNDMRLFEELRRLRMKIAREEAVPPYMIFSDRTLKNMCVILPRNEREMLKVSGVGVMKYSKYGQRFLEVIADNTNNIEQNFAKEENVIEEENHTIPIEESERECENHSQKEMDAELIKKLWKLRSEIAQREGVSPYDVYDDETMFNICATEGRMARLLGEGKYGRLFWDKILEHILKEN